MTADLSSYAPQLIIAVLKSKKYHLEHGELEHGPKSMARSKGSFNATPDLKRSPKVKVQYAYICIDRALFTMYMY